MLLGLVDGMWRVARKGEWRHADGQVRVKLPRMWRQRAVSRWKIRFPAADGAPAVETKVLRVTRTPRYGRVNCAKRKCVALTFDDGPGPDTGRVLDTLRKHKVPATFFVLGSRVGPYASEVAREVWDGHEVANHTWSHRQLTRLSSAEIRSELDRTAAAVERAAGVETRLMRPPYGEVDSRVREAIKAAGYAEIRWSVDTRDWEHRSADAVVAHVVNDTRRGAIILMHDIQQASVDALPRVIDALRERGYTLVTVSNLLGKTHPGAIYSHRP
jgi:peptidoglycan/xylan/chitin deacetylase (PgdA/CDA1 family)